MKWNLVKFYCYYPTMLNKLVIMRHLSGLRSMNSRLLLPEKMILTKDQSTFNWNLLVETNHKFFHSSSFMQKEKKKPNKAQKLDLNEAKAFINVDKYTALMDDEIEALKENFIKNLTVRSSSGSMDQLTVKFEGEEYMLQELVQIVYKPKVVVLNASSFPQAIPQILEMISKSGMNLNPQQDGTTIYIPIPKVTKEHRENLAKNAKSIFIKSRDKIKDIRNKQVKGLKNKPSISEDQIRRIQVQLDALCDNYVKKAESILDNKQKELLKTE
ncbi:ribosome-recycling factor, mitochondrial [Chelonus insularis]|uniref:ribosome-recycling factor, mitochondrial n=1 Tax=Chelonus insularis TaxID=460826 RepID=UPI001589AE4F|nr:ribosome-recycling factor, mitochondrial [Chelonus insularis]